MIQKKPHRCLLLYQPEKKAEHYSPKHWPREALYCWQVSKEVRKSECVRCLVARILSTQSMTVTASDHKQPMTLKEWEKHHPYRKEKK